MSIVIDSSMALAWIYEDEKTAAIDRVLDAVHRDGGWAPAIWRLEVANSLQQGVKQRRVNRAHRDQALANLAQLNILIDGHTDDFAWTDTLILADDLGLTLYDDSYLELARRRKLALATLDRELRTAAKKASIAVL